MSHIPVLKDEMLQALRPVNTKVYIDGTFGGGGYVKAILEHAPKAQLIAFDRDPEAQHRIQEIPPSPQFKLITAPFSEMAQHIKKILTPSIVDGIVFDFGLSSFQIDTPERGFSFQNDGPLDMRMGKSGITAQEVVNTFKESDLADIIYTYGEETRSRKIASLIVKNRPFISTQQLASLIKAHIKGKPRIHPATLTFQALRIYVNDELQEIYNGLNAAHEILAVGGRLVTVSFHALEDRIVKQFFKTKCYKTSRKAVSPSREEVLTNPRSRSAKLRWGIKL